MLLSRDLWEQGQEMSYILGSFCPYLSPCLWVNGPCGRKVSEGHWPWSWKLKATAISFCSSAQAGWLDSLENDLLFLIVLPSSQLTFSLPHYFCLPLLLTNPETHTYTHSLPVSWGHVGVFWWLWHPTAYCFIAPSHRASQLPFLSS